MEDSKTHQLLGQLIEAQHRTSSEVSNLTQNVQAHTSRLADFEHGLRRANDDLMRLRDTVVTPDNLRRVGLDLNDATEHRKDFEHLRAARQSAEERRPILRNVINAVAVAAALGAAAWGWAAVTERARADLQPTEAQIHDGTTLRRPQ